MARAVNESSVPSYVEQWGVAFEAAGESRMAGRVLGYLLVCDPPDQTPAQVGAALKASKGAISMSTQMLTRAGLVERSTIAGQRSSYLRIRTEAFSVLLERKLEELSTWRHLAEDGLDLLGGESRARSQRLREVRDFYAFMERRMPDVLRSWKSRREQPAARRRR